MKQTRENALVYIREKSEKMSKKKADEIAENKKTALKEQMKVFTDMSSAKYCN